MIRLNEVAKLRASRRRGMLQVVSRRNGQRKTSSAHAEKSNPQDESHRKDSE
jgi:hypothetical protein